MNKPRVFIIGDIHGCYDELLDLLDEIRFGAEDRAIAVGDLIVKGPKNREVLDLFISDSRLSSVLGNHDYAVLQFLAGEKIKYTKAQKRAGRELEFDRERYASFLRALPLTVEVKSKLVVHAGVRPGISLDQQDEADLLELRTLGKKRTKRKGMAWYDVYEGEKFVFFGHWPSQRPRVGPKALGLDTGCVYGHRLTACDAETGELFSVPAREEYREGSRRFHASPEDEAVVRDQTFNNLFSTDSIHA